MNNTKTTDWVEAKNALAAINGIIEGNRKPASVTYWIEKREELLSWFARQSMAAAAL